ncbi:ABC transporter ATP-binding protein [Microbacterium sp. No. 7]|uniref:ABC transporter ATP-binding protein n=1 Tax=Microbacterium sp. No. 7 TaxID=1714373 RepID=UPI0006CF7553|nr:ATP-binding cassette domain-containing protein [Microbacterium sp. No. 7]ALJ21844.1 hypothetical protein AOA12_18855 [Microbacterium sp. No. 7]
MTGEVALSAEHVTMRYRGLLALDDVSVAFERGTTTGLIGPNGAGKTTFVNVLSGLVQPTSGRIRFDGQDKRRWSLSSAARDGVGRTFQASKVFRNRMVIDNIDVAPVRLRALEYDPLEIVDLADRRHDLAGSLSYGELRRLGVAIAISTAPRVLLLDEPGAGLTGGDLDRLSAVIRRVGATGCTIVLVDHNMRFLMGSVERVVVLEGGRLVADGTPEQVQNDPQVRAAYLGGAA